jgi:hypothetical protein
MRKKVRLKEVTFLLQLVPRTLLGISPLLSTELE